MVGLDRVPGFGFRDAQFWHEFADLDNETVLDASGLSADVLALVSGSRYQDDVIEILTRRFFMNRKSSEISHQTVQTGENAPGFENARADWATPRLVRLMGRDTAGKSTPPNNETTDGFGNDVGPGS